MQFYVGLHHPSAAQHFDRCMISVKRLHHRKSDFVVNEWMLDSGAFTELRDYGRYRHEPKEYAAQIRRWANCGRLLAASSQDYMCEPIVINGGAVGGHVFVGTKLSVPGHQRLTIERYDALMAESTGVYILPILQGFHPQEYVNHIAQYGTRLAHGAWVGVGSVCKRNGSPSAIRDVLYAIKRERPDLRLHGFGLKRTALSWGWIRAALHSADSMAWSFAARKEGRNANDWREAKVFERRVLGVIDDLPMFQQEATC